jgi:hypothetical protein
VPNDVHIPWSLSQAKPGESCRWECVDGRWVTLELAANEDLGSVIVLCSDGRRELVGSFEDALEIAKRWRTWT